MSESINNIQNDKFFSDLVGSMGTSAVITGGFGSVAAIKSARAAKKVLKTQSASEIIKEFIKKNNANADSFTKSIAMAKNYEKYRDALKSASKAQKALNKMKNGKPTIFQRLLNIGKSSDNIVKKYTARNAEASKVLNDFTAKLKNGEEILGTKVVGRKEVSLNVLDKSLSQNLKGQFKDVMFNPMNLLYAASTIFMRIKDEAIPVFKEKGTAEGIKQVGISTAKSLADVTSNLGFSLLFRTLGTRIGALITPVAPAAASIGGLIGDMFGTFVSNKIITKAFGEDKPKANITEKKENNQKETIDTLKAPNLKTFKGHSYRRNPNNEKIKKALYV